MILHRFGDTDCQSRQTIRKNIAHRFAERKADSDDGIVFRNIHFAGEGERLETILSRNFRQLEIRNLSLEDVETGRILVEGSLNNLKIKEL